MNAQFIERLEWFKTNEKPEVVLLIADDPYKIRLMLAWTNTTVSYTEKQIDLQGEQQNQIWEWLWSNVSYDSEELRVKSSVSDLVFEKNLQFLIGNRLIYPDGTINSFVQRYLREKVLELFESKSKRPRKRTTKA